MSDPPELGAFAAQADTHHRGRLAETVAVSWLGSHGYEVVAVNVVTEVGEIDIVARQGDTLCFCEVKARAEERFGPAIAAVDRRKQARLGRAASMYLVTNPWDGACRFDVLGLDRGADGDWKVTLVQDAFELPASR